MSYSEALVAAGCKILEMKYVGSYQGEWYALVEFEGEVGLVEGNFGSCSVCDSFESEFGWEDSEKEDYQERLAAFGETYLPVLPIDLRITQLEKDIAEHDWGDYQEALSLLKSWKQIYEL